MISTVEGSEGTINDNVNYSGAKVQRVEGVVRQGEQREGRVGECRECERGIERYELGGGRTGKERLEKERV